MPERARDPYQTLGVGPGASEKELRAAYHRLVQLHHPDHNGGSAESARRFEEVQEAYARVRELRGASTRRGAPPGGAPPGGAPPRPGRADSPPPQYDPAVDDRMADLERELREAHLVRERARQAAREAAAQTAGRPSDEELGYVTTDDSFSKILADARAELSERFSEAREHPVAQRVEDLIDEFEQLASKFKTDARRPGGK